MGRQAEGPGPAWRALGLAAAILSSCFLLTQAQEISVTVEPPQPLEGQNVTLTPGGQLDFVLCIWYREKPDEANRIFTYTPSSHQRHPGRNFTGRESGGSDCSLHIKNLMLNDTGAYIVSKVASGGAERGHVKIEVIVSARHVLDKGVIAGIVVGALAGAVLIGGLLYYFFRRYCQRMVRRVSKSSLLPSVPATKPTV